MINYFNFKQFGDKFLITNDTGRFAFIDSTNLRKLINGTITPSDPAYEILKDNYFLIDEHSEVFIRKISSLVRDVKSYTMVGTSLHIFAVTNHCNLKCVYCQAKNNEIDAGKMTIECGEKAIEMALSSPAKYLTFEFQGGEPLLNFDVVKHMIRYSQQINQNKEIQYTIVSNLVLLDDKKLDFIVENNISICTSLDGHDIVHNLNRPMKNIGSSFDYVQSGIKQIIDRGIIPGAIQTTSRFGLKYPLEMVDAYIKMGLSNIFIRPLTPLGFAHFNWSEIGYTPDEYLDFYRQALDYIIEINKTGKRFPELHAGFLLKKILAGTSDNYMELRSPCGAGVGQLSYYYDGNVYTCDEGRMLSEMGDRSFKLGNVFEDTYEDLLKSPTCRATSIASVLESIPSCCDCSYQPYCGVCPVVNYSEGKDIFLKTPRDYRCKIYKGILDILFEKIYRNDETEMSILKSWI